MATSSGKGRKRQGGGVKRTAGEREETVMDYDDKNENFFKTPGRKNTSPKTKARANRDPMVCMIDITSSEQDQNKIPFLVSMPTMNDVVAEVPLMGSSPLELFIMPREASIVPELPSFMPQNAEQRLDCLLQRVRKSLRYTTLMKALDLVDSACIFNQQGGYEDIQQEFCFDDEYLQSLKERTDIGPVERTFLKGMGQELPKLITEALSQRHADGAGRDCWTMIFDLVTQTVVAHILQEQEDYHRVQECEAQVKLLRTNLAQAQDARVKADLEGRIQRYIAEMDTRKYRTPIAYNLDFYLPDEHQLDVKVANNTFQTYFQYLTTEMNEDELDTWHMSAVRDERTRKAPDPESIWAIKEMAKLLKKFNRWPWCANVANDDYCRKPQSYRQSDIAIVYHSSAESNDARISFPIPIVSGEAHGSKAKRYDPAGPFLQLSQPAVSALVFQPVFFGLIIRVQDLSVYEYRRDPDTGLIRCHEQRFVLNGLETGKISDDFKKVIHCLARIVIYQLCKYLPTCLEGLDELVERGYSVYADKSYKAMRKDICTHCWHIKDIADLKAKLRYTASKSAEETPPKRMRGDSTASASIADDEESDAGSVTQ